MYEFEQTDSEKRGKWLSQHLLSKCNTLWKRKCFHKKLFMCFIFFCLCYATEGRYDWDLFGRIAKYRQGAWRPNWIYNHWNISSPWKTVNWNLFRSSSVSSMGNEAFSSFLQSHYFRKQSNWKSSDWKILNWKANCLAALKVACYQTTQVQTEVDYTDWAFSRIKL